MQKNDSKAESGHTKSSHTKISPSLRRLIATCVALTAAPMLSSLSAADSAPQQALQFGAQNNAIKPSPVQPARKLVTPLALPVSLPWALPLTSPVAHAYDHTNDLARDPRFRFDHPLRVFIAVVKDGTGDRRIGEEGRRRGRNGYRGYSGRSGRSGRGDNWDRGGRNGYGRWDYNANRATERARRSLAGRLPDYIRIVDDRRDADLVYVLDMQEFSVRGRITDVDNRRKKYKNKRKRNRAGTDGCGPAIRAHYQRVEERAVARYVFGLKFRERGEGRDIRFIKGRVADSFRFGRNLRAETSCGLSPSQIFPNSDVRRLFERDTPDYRAVKRRDLRQQAERDAVRRVAEITYRRAERHYVRLARDYQAQDYRDGYNEGYRNGYRDGF